MKAATMCRGKHTSNAVAPLRVYWVFKNGLERTPASIGVSGRDDVLNSCWDYCFSSVLRSTSSQNSFISESVDPDVERS